MKNNKDNTEPQQEKMEEDYTLSESSSDERYLNLNVLRVDDELFKDDDNVKYKVINARRIRLPKNGEDWEILEDGKVVMTLKGTRFTKTEKKFLYTPNGMKFLVDCFKSGADSILKFKKELKKVV